MLKKYIFIAVFMVITTALSGCINIPEEPIQYNQLQFSIYRNPSVTLPVDYIYDQYYMAPIESILNYYPYGAWIQILNNMDISKVVPIKIHGTIGGTVNNFKDIKIIGGTSFSIPIVGASIPSEIIWPLDESDPSPPSPDDAWFAAHGGSIHGMFEAKMNGDSIPEGEIVFGGTFQGRISGKRASLSIHGKQIGGYAVFQANININIHNEGENTIVVISGFGHISIPVD